MKHKKIIMLPFHLDITIIMYSVKDGYFIFAKDLLKIKHLTLLLLLNIRVLKMNY